MERGAAGEQGSICVICASVCVVKRLCADTLDIASYLHCCLTELHSSAFPLIVKKDPY